MDPYKLLEVKFSFHLSLSPRGRSRTKAFTSYSSIHSSMWLDFADKSVCYLFRISHPALAHFPSQTSTNQEPEGVTYHIPYQRFTTVWKTSFPFTDKLINALLSSLLTPNTFFYLILARLSLLAMQPFNQSYRSTHAHTVNHFLYSFSLQISISLILFLLSSSLCINSKRITNSLNHLHATYQQFSTISLHPITRW